MKKNLLALLLALALSASLLEGQSVAAPRA